MNAVAKLPKPDKPKRISAKVMRAVTCLENGEAKTISAAASMCGLSREYLSRSLAKSHVVDVLHARAKRKLSIAVVRAAQVKVELLDCESSHVRQEASSEVLALAGIIVRGDKPAPLVSINNVVQPGYVVRIATPETIEGQVAEVRPGVVEHLPGRAP